MPEPTVDRVVAAILSKADPRPHMTACLEQAKRSDAEGRTALFTALNDAFKANPPPGFGPLALLSGAIVEVGGDPLHFPSAIFDHLAHWLGTLSPDDTEQELPEDYFLCERAAMACLSRSARLRATLPQKALLRSRIRRYQERYGFLGKMLAVLDDAPVVVVHQPTRRGWRGTMSGIADNFELHHWLLLGLSHALGFERPPPLASGEVISSRLQLANWPSLQTPDGLADSTHWIWNEGFPEEIAPFDGARVVVVGQSSMQRNWRASKIFEALKSDLELKTELVSADVEALISAIKTKSA